MTSMCGSGKSHAMMNAGGYYRPSPYAYQVSFYIYIVVRNIIKNIFNQKLDLNQI